MLFTQVRRTFQRRIMQVILIGIMIVMSSMMFSMMYYAIEGSATVAFDYLEKHNQEDLSISSLDIITPADVTHLSTITGCDSTTSSTVTGLMLESYTCYEEVVNNRASLLQSAYSGSTVEYRELKRQSTSDGHFIYLVGHNDSSTINVPYFETGTKPTQSDEIALTPYYMEQNNLSLNDKITVNDIEYTITATVLFPDITYGMFDGNIFIDLAKASFSYIPYSDFTTITDYTTHNSYYSVDIGDYSVGDKEVTDFVDKFNSSYDPLSELSFAVQATTTESNMRSGGIVLEFESGASTSIAISALIAAIAIIIVAIIVGQVVKKERTQIGLLKALGFKRKQIITPYVLLIAIFSFILLILGFFIGTLISPLLGDMYRIAYIIPLSEVQITLQGALLGILIPFIVIVSSTLVIMLILMRDNALKMLLPVERKLNFLVRMFSNKMKNNPIRKFSTMITLSSIPKLVMFLFTVIMASFLLLFSFSMSGYLESTDKFINITDYEYSSYIMPGTDLSTITYSNVVDYAIEETAVVGTTQSTLNGLDSDNTLHRIYDKKDKDITSNLSYNKVIVSYAYKSFNKTSIGDTLTLQIGLNTTIDVEVIGFTGIYDTSEQIYIERSFLATSLGESTDYYNKVYSSSDSDFSDKSIFIGVTSKEELREMTELMSTMLNISMIAMVLFSFSIGFIILYVVISLVIEDNFYNLSLLKVVGFDKNQVNKMIFSGLFMITVISFLISIPIVMLMLMAFEMILATIGMIFPMYFGFIHVLISLLIVLGVFFFVVYLSQRKINQISLQESLKLYQD